VHPSKFGSNQADRSGSATAVTLPTVCPGCQSRSISTTARSPDEHAYWRCGECGEIWNVARRRAQPSRIRPWR
jgi:transposase-like protein